MAVPDTDTIDKLQDKYAAAVIASGQLPPAVLAKLELMGKLRTKAARNQKRDPKDKNELDALAVELAPYIHFQVELVDWDKEWNARTRVLRHKGVVVRLEDD